MELSNSYIYKVYLKNISEKYLDDLDIIIYNDIGGVYIKCIYINIIMCVPIDTINI